MDPESIAMSRINEKKKKRHRSPSPVVEQKSQPKTKKIRKVDNKPPSSSLASRALTGTSHGVLSIVWSFGNILDHVRWNRINKQFRALNSKKKFSLRHRLQLIGLRCMYITHVESDVTRFLETSPFHNRGVITNEEKQEMCYICLRVPVPKRPRQMCIPCLFSFRYLLVCFDTGRLEHLMFTLSRCLKEHDLCHA
jgi:hypothetical protein